MTSVDERFWSKVDKNGPVPDQADLGRCWIWTAGKTRGYGHFRLRGKYGELVLAHRRSYELLVGPIPSGLFVLHHCDNPPCVNPEHLFLGTNADNMQDMARKGRAFCAPGEANGRAKLTLADVDQIRRRYVKFDRQFGARALAAQYGVSDVTISKAVRGVTYAGEFDHPKETT